MSFPDSELLSSLRAVRKVISPDISLKNLLHNARTLSDEVASVPGVLDPLVYATEGLRLTLFERRYRAGKTANDLLRRMHARMESPSIPVTRKTRQQLGEVLDISKRKPIPLPEVLRMAESLYKDPDSPLIVRANKIVVSSHYGDSRKGTELALEIESGIGASVLEAQRDMILTAEKTSADGRKLRELANEPINPLHLPFVRVPLKSDYARDEFIASLSVDLPVTDIEIGPVAWKLSTVAYDND